MLLHLTSWDSICVRVRLLRTGKLALPVCCKFFKATCDYGYVQVELQVRACVSSAELSTPLQSLLKISFSSPGHSVSFSHLKHALIVNAKTSSLSHRK